MEPQLDSFEFAKAFNDGFIVGMYEQEIAEDMLACMQTNTDYLFGFKSGLDEGDKERIEQTRLNMLDDMRIDQQQQSNEQEQGIDQ
ncbi:MAG: hypothetical protein POELPBGB_02964 [Bacteroidia bacterium]|nr:hypothetical protein [Bacteroidia bacterium]